MKRATDKHQYEKLIKAGFTVAPDRMWCYTTLKGKPLQCLEEYYEAGTKSALFICPAWSLSLLIESIPKFTSYGWFAIKWSQRTQSYFVGYQDDEGAFTKCFPQRDLLDAVYHTLLWMLENPAVVEIGKKYIDGNLKMVKKGGTQ